MENVLLCLIGGAIGLVLARPACCGGWKARA
jgi:hypothetical protein